jgi:hypothetical protein
MNEEAGSAADAFPSSHCPAGIRESANRRPFFVHSAFLFSAGPLAKLPPLKSACLCTATAMSTDMQHAFEARVRNSYVALNAKQFDVILANWA